MSRGEARDLLPKGFEERMRRLLGDEADLLCAALAEEPAAGLRVNPARMDLARLARVTGWGLRVLPWSEEAAVLDAGSDRPGLHPLHEAGAYYLQEPSATAPAVALDVRPGERVIDLAAAPGGKATALAAALGGRGLLVANDVHPKRVTALARNLERWGARRALITNEEPARLAERWRGTFDAVLLDAPCSGEGMFRKSEEARADWSEETVRTCGTRQASLLDAAADLLAPGGRLVYSTCTFSPEENEQVVAELLLRRTELRPHPFTLPGLDRGRVDWIVGPARRAAEGLAEATARAWPHRTPGEGHFVARLRREPSAGPEEAAAEDRSRGPHGGARRRAPTGGGPRRRAPAEADAAPAEAVAAWRAFRDESLAAGAPGPVDEEGLVLRGEALWWPSGAGDTSGLRVLRDGLPLGRWRKGRFEPAHALAQATAEDERRSDLDLPADHPALAAYLAGHELDADDLPPGPRAGVADGWRVCTVHGAPLGWVRRSGARFRNLYPKGLRRA